MRSKGMSGMKEYKTYEEAVERLTEIVSFLETGDQPLEETLALFEEGTQLTAFCYGKLKDAEQKIKILTVPEEKENE